MGIEWPKLSRDLTGPRSPAQCQACGATEKLGRWQEHNDIDKPLPVVVVLCGPCADRLIEPHPRLYRRLARNEPFPGTMRVCLDCTERDGVNCKSPMRLSNGGEGLPFPAADSTAHFDGTRGGKRCGWTVRTWSAEPTGCKGKIVADATT